MMRVLCIVLILSLTGVLNANEDRWIGERIPASNPFLFLVYYQQFLQENPFAIDTFRKTPEVEAENKRKHERAAEFYAQLADAAKRLARTGGLLQTAPQNIEKKDTDRIRGSWNLYRQVPLNVADLYEEALYMQYRSLGHQASLDTAKIAQLYEFVSGLPKDLALQQDQALQRGASGQVRKAGRSEADSLYQTLMRSVCRRALSAEDLTAEKISQVADWFAPFAQEHPNEKNIVLFDAFLNVIEKTGHSEDEKSTLTGERPTADGERLASELLPVVLQDVISRLMTVFTDIQSREVEPIVKEYAEMYAGVLRRWNLLGKPMPIWGADGEGKVFDEAALEGKVVLLDFWATWCGPCLAEFPHLKLLYEKYKDRGFEIVGYNVDSEPERLQAYMKGNPLPWIVLSKESSQRAGLSALSQYYGARALPVVMLRDREGKTVLLNARGQRLDAVLENLFEENL